MTAIGEPSEERLEHARRRRKPVQQKDCGRVFRTGLPVENRKPIDLCGAIECRIFHRMFPSVTVESALIGLARIVSIKKKQRQPRVTPVLCPTSIM